MESPASWTEAEWIVNRALSRAEQGRIDGMVGLSTVRQITDALRAAGLLGESDALGVFSDPG